MINNYLLNEEILTTDVTNSFDSNDNNIPPENENNTYFSDVMSSFRFKKVKTKTTFKRVSEMIKKKIKGLKPNNLAVSYSNRFLIPLIKILYYKTVRQNYLRPLLASELELLFLYYLENNIQSIEEKERYKRSLSGFYFTYVPMINRNSEQTIVTVTHCVKNTFTNIFRQYQIDVKKMLAKLSSGLIGFRGPKKSTVFARKGVIKETGKLLSGYMTSLLEVIFTSKVSRWNRKSVRDLSPNLNFITSIKILYTRAHGKIKHKNEQRK